MGEKKDPEKQSIFVLFSLPFTKNRILVVGGRLCVCVGASEWESEYARYSANSNYSHRIVGWNYWRAILNVSIINDGRILDFTMRFSLYTIFNMETKYFQNDDDKRTEELNKRERG